MSSVGNRVFCRNCGKEVAERAVVCVGCGLRPHDSNKFCPSCAAETQPAAVVCIKCGVPLTPARPAKAAAGPPQPKDPIVCALLGLVPGLGQIIAGQVLKGLAILVLAPVVLVIGAVLTLGLFFYIGVPLFPLLSAVDAYLVATKMKQGLPVGDWEFFPR